MKILQTPITLEQIKDLRIGDTVFIDGTIVTCRDDGHKHYLSGHKPKLDLAGLGIYHAGPIIKETNGKYEVISVGPTTSRRMEPVEDEFIKKSKAKVYIGKGGMGAKTALACKNEKAIHCLYCGGCGVIAADSVTEVVDVEWLELGMPEAMWIFKVKHFGPLIVSIDTEGNNLFEINKKEFDIRKELVKTKLHKEIDK
ncbi:MAG: FumA C-terminus/TtdB family hydratase beta subunit [Clostridia bacterium]